MNRIEGLHKKVLTICKEYRVEKWSNSWMWKREDSDISEKLLNYFLIQLRHSYFNYDDVGGISIKVSINNSISGEKLYRIDIKENFGIHNFWYFDYDKFDYVSRYVLELVSNQYESIIKKFNLLSLSRYGYGEIEPEGLYKRIDHIIRGEKLERILK